jgi:membrane dipeptidase
MAETAYPPIFDGHNDVLHKIHAAGPLTARSFFEAGGSGHLDFPRAAQVGFRGGLFAVYPPNPPEVPPALDRLIPEQDGYRVEIAPPLSYDYAARMTREMIDLLYQIQAESEGRFTVVRKARELRDHFLAGTMTAVLHLEGAEAVRPDLSNLEDLYQQGLRSLGLTWSRENAFGCGVPFAIPSPPDIGPGLKPPGKELVQACNQLGVLIDLAHLNEHGFWDVAELSDAPLVSSHTAAHALTPRSRNLTDEQLQAVAQTGGLVGVTFSVNDLDGGRRPKQDAPLEALIRHIRYLVELIGIDHVAFGSDLDGTTISSEIGDVTGFRKIFQALEEAGFTDDELGKIAYQNWLRVLEKTWS